MSAVPETITQPLPTAISAKMPVIEDGEYSILFDTAKFEQAFRVARLFSASKFVPEAYQGSPENCFLALQMATRLRIDPMMFMQKTYIVHNKPGMEATLVIALINSRGPFEGPIQWRIEGQGMGRKCVAFAKHKVTGELCEAECSMEMAKAEGWLDKSGSKWKTIPDLMLKYRSASFLGRLYAPECLMGMQTLDELDDITPRGEIDVTPKAEARGAGALLREVATRPAATPTATIVDRDTGEITQERSGDPAAVEGERTGNAEQVQQEQTGKPPAAQGPTLEDAIAHIKRGEYDEARDIVRGTDQAETVEGMIKSHQGAAQQQEAQPRARGGRGQRSVE